MDYCFLSWTQVDRLLWLLACPALRPSYKRHCALLQWPQLVPGSSFQPGKTDETRAVSTDLALSVRPSKLCIKYSSCVGGGGIDNAGRLGIWCLGPVRTQWPSVKWSSPAPEHYRPTEELVKKKKGHMSERNRVAMSKRLVVTGEAEEPYLAGYVQGQTSSSSH